MEFSKARDKPMKKPFQLYLEIETWCMEETVWFVNTNNNWKGVPMVSRNLATTRNKQQLRVRWNFSMELFWQPSAQNQSCFNWWSIKAIVQLWFALCFSRGAFLSLLDVKSQISWKQESMAKVKTLSGLRTSTYLNGQLIESYAIAYHIRRIICAPTSQPPNLARFLITMWSSCFIIITTSLHSVLFHLANVVDVGSLVCRNNDLENFNHGSISGVLSSQVELIIHSHFKDWKSFRGSMVWGANWDD